MTTIDSYKAVNYFTPVVNKTFLTAYRAYTYNYTLDPDNTKELNFFIGMLHSLCEYSRNIDIEPYTNLSVSQLKFVLMSIDTNTYKLVQNFDYCYTVCNHPTMLLNSRSLYWDIHKFFTKYTKEYKNTYDDTFDTKTPFWSKLQFSSKLEQFYNCNYDLIWDHRNYTLLDIIRVIRDY